MQAGNWVGINNFHSNAPISKFTLIQEVQQQISLNLAEDFNLLRV